jgi:hypothetical protein
LLSLRLPIFCFQATTVAVVPCKTYLQYVLHA